MWFESCFPFNNTLKSPYKICLVLIVRRFGQKRLLNVNVNERFMLEHGNQKGNIQYIH